MQNNHIPLKDFGIYTGPPPKNTMAVGENDAESRDRTDMDRMGKRQELRVSLIRPSQSPRIIDQIRISELSSSCRLLVTLSF